MTKITLKISTFLFLTMLAFQVQAQVWTVNGVYKISVPGEDLYMTIDPGTLNVVWDAQISGDSELQLWTITDHRTPASAGLMEITANVTGIGTLTMTTGSVAAHPVYDMTVRIGEPASVAVGAGDYSGLDQFQRRRSAGFGGPGNDALFFRTTEGTNSRWGLAAVDGAQVQFDGGGIDVLEFTLISALSNEEFDTSSIFISNPVNNEIRINGLTSNVKEVSVYSLLGQKMITEEVNAESSLTMDASSLSSGMYLVEMKGENGSFTKKIVKQ
jgi:hypothetical protein